jgi:hypothetical protein
VKSYVPHEPHPKQQAFLRLRCRVAGYGGAGGGGKSDAQLMAALQGVGIPSYRALLLRNTYRDLALPGAIMDRAHEWWDDTDAEWSERDKTWTFPTGARISFGFLEHLRDLGRYQSTEVHYIGFDESSLFKPVLIKSMFGRLRRRKTGFPTNFPLRVRLTTNPGGIAHKWHMQYFGIPKSAQTKRLEKPIVTRDEFGKVQRVFIPAYVQDNPGLDVEGYLENLAELPKMRRMQLRDGLWVEDSTLLCYSNASMARTLPRLPDGYEWSYILGVDFGATKNYAMTIYAVCEELSELFMVKSWKPKVSNTTDLGNLITRLIETWNFFRIVGDHGALGAGYIDELRKRFGIPIQNAEKKNKRGYIELFNDALEYGGVVIITGRNPLDRIDPSNDDDESRVGPCDEWFDEAEGLIWADERKLEEASGLANHCCDSSLYAWREAKHYTVTLPKRPLIVPADSIEKAVLERVTRERRGINRDGMRLPDLLRRR